MNFEWNDDTEISITWENDDIRFVNNPGIYLLCMNRLLHNSESKYMSTYFIELIDNDNKLQWEHERERKKEPPYKENESICTRVKLTLKPLFECSNL